MTRLTHSSGGFARSLQMSSASFFAFVEGGLDRPFFDRLIAAACAARGIKHQVIAVREIPGSAGGKIALLALFREYRRTGKLLSTAFGKTMVCAFFADKDSDDFSRSQLRSPHLFYTQTYDLEAHLFKCGDLQRALADACGLTLQQAKLLIPDQSAWLLDVATKWRDWTVLCLISQTKRVNCGCTYDRASAVNANLLGPPDAGAVESFKVRLCASLAISRHDFDLLFREVERRLNATLNSGQPLRYFKGKWLLHVLQRMLESAAKPADALINSAGDKVTTALLSQVASNPGCQCCAPFSPGLAKLVLQVT